MQPKPLNAMLILLAAAAGLAGGFFLGKREGAKPGQVDRALATHLRDELKESHRKLEKLQLLHDDIAGELSDAHFDAAECQSRLDQFLELHEEMNFVGPVLPASPVSGDDEALTLQRIEELECEVASLKELANKDRLEPIDQPAVPQSLHSSGAASVTTGEIPLPKEQCSATTKKGARCSRSARANGKCWQHGG